ncbi:MAG: family 16 glycoside hydrolase [Anaerolineaceae bacterium]|nr:family 16 glycoside hydrolase [Anaerolineaceae bacterium]
MNRWFRTFLLLPMLLLASCNFPQPQKALPVDPIGTAVVETLTAQPVVEPTPTQTPVPAPVETLIPTPTPSETPTPTSSPTPTVSPEDPVTWLGSPARRDPLESGSGFGLSAAGYEDANTSLSIGNGVMVLKSSSASGWRGWRLRPPAIQDFYLEAIYRTVVCSGADVYGIVFRAPDPNYADGQGYYFGVTCDGRYSLTRRAGDGSRVLVNPTSSDALNPGTNQFNRIGAMVKGANIKLYINGKMVRELDDTSITTAGAFGGFIGGFSGNLTVEMDEIAYWNLP